MIHSQSSARRALVHTNHKKKGVSPAGETPRFFRFRGPRYTLDTIDADPDRIPRVPSSSPTRRPRRPRRGRTRKRTRYVRLHPPRVDVRVAGSPRPRASSNQRPSDALEGETVWSHTERWLITKRSPRAFKRRHERATKPRFQIVRNSPVRFHPSPSRTNRRVAAHSFEIPSRNPSKRKSLRLSHRANTHLRLAKQPAGGATENRARGVRVELGRRPDRRGGVRRRLFLGADDEGGAAGGGRPAGRRPRGHAHLGRGRREAQHVSMDASRCADRARRLFRLFSALVWFSKRGRVGCPFVRRHDTYWWSYYYPRIMYTFTTIYLYIYRPSVRSFGLSFFSPVRNLVSRLEISPD